ncbi:hypothetical protein Tco_0728961 [Tanacetum coccineum]|uniref:Uncharacterized protein n=1 Tax=Tanacetum coccineum TaxID=301880 RepID=A0ABQ4YN28_9ASTR
MLGRSRVPLCVIEASWCVVEASWCIVEIVWIVEYMLFLWLLSVAIEEWYVIGVATLRALVRAGDKTSGDTRSWYMISGDAKSWVLDCSAYIHSHIAQLCVVIKGNEEYLGSTMSTFGSLLKGMVYPLVAPVQTPLSPKWSSGYLLVSPSSPVVPSPIASLVATSTATISVGEDQFIEVGAQLELHGSILQDHTQRLDALPPTLIADIDRDVRELYTRSGVVRAEIFLQRYRFRSLEHEQERTAVMFGALWRSVLALKALAGHVDTLMADMSRAGYDDHRMIHDMLVQQTAM